MLIGCDPEMFVYREGKYVDPTGLIPGDKETPFAVSGGAVQVDGLAVEFNTEPASTKEAFISNINEVIEEMSKLLPEYDLRVDTDLALDWDVWDTISPESKQIGCDPDYSAYTMQMNTVSQNAQYRPLRGAGGHIHLSFDGSDSLSFEEQARLVRLLDLYVGIPLRLAEGHTQRSETYGRLGNFRPKPYGVEYRTPSNFWLKAHQEWVYDQCTLALDKFLDGEDAPQEIVSLFEYFDEEVANDLVKY